MEKNPLTAHREHKRVSAGENESSSEGGISFAPSVASLTATSPDGNGNPIQRSTKNNNSEGGKEDKPKEPGSAVIPGNARKVLMDGREMVPVFSSIPKYQKTLRGPKADASDPEAIYLRKMEDRVIDALKIKAFEVIYTHVDGITETWVLGSVYTVDELGKGAHKSYYFRFSDLMERSVEDQTVMPPDKIAEGFREAFRMGENGMVGTNEEDVFFYCKAVAGNFGEVEAAYGGSLLQDLIAELDENPEELRHALTILDLDSVMMDPGQKDKKENEGTLPAAVIMPQIEAKCAAGDESVFGLVMGLPEAYYGKLSFSARMWLIDSLVFKWHVGGKRESALLMLLQTTPESQRGSLFARMMASEGALFEELNKSLDDESMVHFYTLLNLGVASDLLAGGDSLDSQPKQVLEVMGADQETVDGAESMHVFPFAVYGMVRSGFKVETDYKVQIKEGKVEVTLTKEPPADDMAMLGSIPIALGNKMVKRAQRGKPVTLEPTEMVAVQMIHRNQRLEGSVYRGEANDDLQIMYMPAINLKMLEKMESEAEVDKFVTAATIAAAAFATATTGNPTWLMFETLDLMLTIADAVVQDYRFELMNSEEGRNFMAVWEPLQMLVGLVGVSELVVNSPKLVKSLMETIPGMVSWANQNAPDLAKALQNLLDELLAAQKQVAEGGELGAGAKALGQGGDTAESGADMAESAGGLSEVADGGKKLPTEGANAVEGAGEVDPLRTAAQELNDFVKASAGTAGMGGDAVQFGVLLGKLAKEAVKKGIETLDDFVKYLNGELGDALNIADVEIRKMVKRAWDEAKGVEVDIKNERQLDDPINVEQSIEDNLKRKKIPKGKIDEFVLNAKILEEETGRNDFLKTAEQIFGYEGVRNPEDIVNSLQVIDLSQKTKHINELNEWAEGLFYLRKGEEVSITKKFNKRTNEIDVRLETSRGIVECKRVSGKGESNIFERMNDIIEKFTLESKLTTEMKHSYPGRIGQVRIDNGPLKDANKDKLLHYLKEQGAVGKGDGNYFSIEDLEIIDEFHFITSNGRFVIYSSEWKTYFN